MVRRLLDSSVRLGEQRYGSEEELRRALLRLLAVAVEQRARKLDERNRGPLGQQQIAQVLVQARHKGLARESLREHLVKADEGLGVVAPEEQIDHREVGVVVQHVECLRYGLVLQVGVAERDGLVEHRERIAHTSVGLLGDEVERLLVELNALLLGDVFQVTHRILDADAVEVIDLAAREDGGYDFVFLGCGEDEDGVARRLLERLEEGVESLLREHMYLVDDEERVASHLRQDAHLLDEGADVVHRVVRGGIQLVDVERASLVEGAARFALVAGLRAVGIQAVDRLGEDTRTGGLTHATRPAEEVGVRQLTTLDGVFQRRGDALLSHYRFECRGAVFSCRNNKFAHNFAKVVRTIQNSKFKIQN